MGTRQAPEQRTAHSNVPKMETMAKELGVGQKTVERAEKFAKGIDKIAEVSPEAVEQNRKE